jgi:uncharacterized protein (DUF2236 family)
VVHVPLPSDDEALLALADLARPPGAAGLFDDDGWLRRINGESALLFGGGRALLLEIAHPLVAAGVAEHSDFRRDPFGRLQRTLDAMSKLVFGDTASALAAARGVERSHARVRGTLRERTGPFAAGTPYDGRDPELVRWVWATLVDTAVQVYALFVAPLPPHALEAYYRDHRAVGRLLGVPPEAVPPSWPAFRTWFDGVVESDCLHVGAQAREIAEAVLHRPVGLQGAGTVRLVTTALLPPRLREAFGLPWEPERAQRFDALVASVRRLRDEGAQGAGNAAPAARRSGDLR